MGMGKTNRNLPKNAKSSDSKFTRFDLEREFPDDAACLDYLVAKLYPEGIFCPTCNKVTKHHRIKARPAYACQFCGHQEHPMKGTIFEGSSTSLGLWFQAIYLMASTRCGISAKQLERETGVSYPTALRMFRQIRSLLGQDSDERFSGTIEADEAYIGGIGKWKHANKRGHAAAFSTKTPVFGMAQRGEPINPQRKRGPKSGKVVAKVVEHASTVSVMPHMTTKVLPGSTVFTDEGNVYQGLKGHGFEHQRVNHSQAIYVDGDAHVNTIEGFWSLLKSGIRGTYHSVSTTHLQSYLDEYAFRYNNREATGRGMFDAFLDRIEKASPTE
jgi:transposase